MEEYGWWEDSKKEKGLIIIQIELIIIQIELIIIQMGLIIIHLSLLPVIPKYLFQSTSLIFKTRRFLFFSFL